jgi:hypothetical protein
MHFTSRGGTQRVVAACLLPVFLLSLTIATSGCGGSLPSVATSSTDPPPAKTLTSIAISPVGPSIVQGQSKQLTAAGVFSDGSKRDMTQSVTWASTQPSIASINQSGLASGNLAGSATITATSGSIAASDTLTVMPVALVSIAVSPQSPSVPKGMAKALDAVATFSDGTQLDITDSATWSAAPTGIATVSATGVVTGQAVGSATITASLASVSGSDSLSVSPAILVSIAVSPVTSSIMLGATEQLASTGTFSDGSTQDLTNSMAWSSANTSMVRISPAGLAVAESVGSTTISAASGAVSGSAGVTVAAQEMLTYFSQANNPATTLDATVRITNVGMTNGPLCAMVYVFDTRQEMTECCACSLSPDDLRTLSVNQDLTNHPATGVIPRAGVVEIISAEPASDQTCNASNLPAGGELAAWSTHIQILAADTFSTTEAPFEVVGLSGTHLSTLQSECGFLMTNTPGMCTCGTGD